MVQWICELGRVQPNNNSVNEIFVRVGVRGRKLKVGGTILIVFIFDRITTVLTMGQ